MTTCGNFYLGENSSSFGVRPQFTRQVLARSYGAYGHASADPRGYGRESGWHRTSEDIHQIRSRVKLVFYRPPPDPQSQLTTFNRSRTVRTTSVEVTDDSTSAFEASPRTQDFVAVATKHESGESATGRRNTELRRTSPCLTTAERHRRYEVEKAADCISFCRAKGHYVSKVVPRLWSGCRALKINTLGLPHQYPAFIFATAASARRYTGPCAIQNSQPLDLYALKGAYCGR